MSITLHDDLPDRDQSFNLFISTGWNEEYQLDREQLRAALEGSWTCVSAYDDGRLVGFGRVVSDGILHALIVDLVVAPSHKGQGLGSALLKELVDRCQASAIRDIQLFCAQGQAGFYEKHGFVQRPAAAPGMELKHT